LVFSRMRPQRYLVGGPVDFLFFPVGCTPLDVIKVVVHRGSERPSRVPEYKWCAYPT
jgi:hypothetical protein